MFNFKIGVYAHLPKTKMSQNNSVNLIECVENYKYLGLIFCNSLLWKLA